jgi:signal peptidase I
MMRRLLIWLIPLAMTPALLSLALAHGPDLFVEQTSSMTPLIRPGDLVVDHRLSANETLKVGQIVGYRYGDMLVTHRIIGVNYDGTYTIKGDANPLPDPLPVNRSQIRESVLFTVPAAGKALAALTSLPGAIAIALLIFAGGMLFIWLRRRHIVSLQLAKLLEFRRREDEDGEEQRRAA